MLLEILNWIQGSDKKQVQEMISSGTSLAVRWLRLPVSTAAGMGLIPGWGTKVPHAARPKKKRNDLFKYAFLHTHTPLQLLSSILLTRLAENYC